MPLEGRVHAMESQRRWTEGRYDKYDSMLLIDNKDITDPAVNLSIEEYCLKNLNPKNDYLIFYINDPSVVIGKNQNPFQETNHAYAKKNDIRIVRRISGGGAVYHDHGNVNFSFITAFGKNGLNDFKRLLQPILMTLEDLGAAPVLMANNTIFVKEKKISGNAQYTNLNRMLSHGTLLFDADLASLDKALGSAANIVSSKGVASIRSTVTNISEHAVPPTDMSAFKEKLIEGAEKFFNGLTVQELSETAWDDIHRLARDKYRSWEWNYGNTPPFIVRHGPADGSGENALRYHVERGIIRKIETESGSRDVSAAAVEKKWVGKRYDPEMF